jgi:hypothetical protein
VLHDSLSFLEPELISKDNMVFLGFEVLTEVVIKSSAFWDIMAFQINTDFFALGARHYANSKVQRPWIIADKQKRYGVSKV